MTKQHPNISIFTKFLSMKCAFQSDIIFLHRNEVANMALYEIKNYIKLLCIRIDHIESYVVDEVNYSQPTLCLEVGASQSISLMRQVYLGYLDSSCRSHSQTFIENIYCSIYISFMMCSTNRASPFSNRQCFLPVFMSTIRTYLT